MPVTAHAASDQYHVTESERAHSQRKQAWCFNLLFVAVMNTMTKDNSGRTEVILSHKLPFITQGRRSRNSSQSSTKETKNGGTLFTCLLPVTFSVTSLYSSGILVQGCPSSRGLNPPPLIRDQENVP